METWLKLSCILCFFGFLKEIRPSEPYIYEYLSGPWRNISGIEVVTEVYPVGTYSYLVLLVLVFLITDLLRYKPLIVALGLSGIVFSGMLIWTKSLLALQILEVFYSIFMATEVAYYTYIYAKVEKEHYQAVTSYTRASLLVGRFFSGVVAQVLISFNVMNYKELNYITFTAMIMATYWTLFLPSVSKSIYFNREGKEELSKILMLRKGLTLMKTEISKTFTETYIIKWSIWYALGTCCFLQVQIYMQPLWSDILADPKKVKYNGAVEAALTLLGFCGALFAGMLKVNWEAKGDILRIVCSFVQGVIVITSTTTNNIYISYICYIIFGLLYHFVITITSSEIAKYLKDDTYGLIFGFNTFIAMIFQSILTLVVVNGLFGLILNIREQYLIYGYCCFFLALIDVVHSIYRSFFRRVRTYEMEITV